MAETLTPVQRLSESLFEQRHGSTLTEYVVTKRLARPRWGWKLIAEQLAADTDGQLVLSHESLRSWYGDLARTENAA